MVRVLRGPPREILCRLRGRASDSLQLSIATAWGWCGYRGRAREALGRALPLRLAAEDHVLLLTLHHIVSDAWTRGILNAEIGALYEAFREGKPAPLAWTRSERRRATITTIRSPAACGR